MIGIPQFFQNYLPGHETELKPFHYHPKKDRELEIWEDFPKSLASIEQDLIRATEITLRLSKPEEQNVILCDASYHGAEFILSLLDYHKTGSSRLQRS